MQALILAAGRGSRLGQKSEGVPKCLLEIGRRPLIEHQLESLAEAGIGPVAMVLGYCSDEIQEVVGIRAEYIQNPRWNVTNSLYSFWLAREWVSGPVLVLNSDILFHPGILDRVLEIKGDVLAYDSSSGHGLEHMKVKVADGKLALMSKKLAPPDVSGENLGILCFTAETAKALLQRAGEMVAEGGENRWVGTAISEVAKEREIRAVDVAGLPWGEADFAYDLHRLRKEVWPAIRRDRRKATVAWRRAAIFVAAGLALALVLRTATNPVVLAKETLDIRGVADIQLHAGDRVQKWWLIEASSTATFHVTGPRVLEIQSRPVLSQAESNPVPYVLEVALDGHRLDWFKEAAGRSGTWNHSELSVGKCQKLFCDIPAGAHEITVRLVASDAGKCLVRAQIPSEQTPDD